jgi:ABC-type transport system involved in cytochrome bd biosynthesis fused ATPase/permease subunit
MVVVIIVVMMMVVVVVVIIVVMVIIAVVLVTVIVVVVVDTVVMVVIVVLVMVIAVTYFNALSRDVTLSLTKTNEKLENSLRTRALKTSTASAEVKNEQSSTSIPPYIFVAWCYIKDKQFT